MDEEIVNSNIEKLRNYMEGTDEEKMIEVYVEKLINDDRVDNSDVIPLAMKYFEKVVPAEIKKKLYDEINKIYE